MLVEKTRLVEVVAEVKNDTHTYDVTYKTAGGALVKAEVVVNKKIVEKVTTPGGIQDAVKFDRIGFMSYESGNKNVNIRNNDGIAPYAEMFEQILSEITASLAPVPVATKAAK